MAIDSKIQAIERATNKSWDDWLKFMDKIGAKNLNHHEIATKVLYELMGKVENPGWWTQATTVAYEQYSGKRVPGQRPDGTFQTSVSKSTKLEMQKLMDEWAAFAAEDKEVLGAISAAPRVSGTDRRISWRAKAKDGSAVTVISEPKGSVASIVIQLIGLQSLELNNQAKAKWTAILERFLKSI